MDKEEIDLIFQDLKYPTAKDIDELLKPVEIDLFFDTIDFTLLLDDIKIPDLDFTLPEIDLTIPEIDFSLPEIDLMLGKQEKRTVKNGTKKK